MQVGDCISPHEGGCKERFSACTAVKSSTPKRLAISTTSSSTTTTQTATRRTKQSQTRSTIRRRKDRVPSDWRWHNSSAEVESGQFSKSVLKLKSKRATRAVEIKKLLADAQENEEAQHTATETRAKENAAYMAKRAEMQEAAAAMEKALTVLSSQALLKVSSALRNAQHVHFSAKQREWLQLLEQEGWTGAAYAPQSATIQGILVNLNETLIKSLEKAEHSEATLHRHFEKLMKTQQDEFLALRETVSKKQCSHDEAVCLLQSFDEHFKKRRETKKERDCVDVKSRWREQHEEQHEMLQCAMRCVSQSPPSLRGAKDVLHRMGIRLPLDLKENFDPCDPGYSGKTQLMKLLIADLQRKASDKEVMQPRAREKA